MTSSPHGSVEPQALGPDVLPEGIRARFVDNANGLRMHVLEAGFESPGRPCVLLLHGFPELAYSWRKVMLPLARAGLHVVAPDQRGYGRTVGWDPDYDGDLGSYRVFNLVRDALGLVSSLGYRSVAGVFGHDFGSRVAGWCALMRPDVFGAVALMSAPFAGPAPLPFGLDRAPGSVPALRPATDLNQELASLPRPRKHYQWHYSTREANRDMWNCPQGVHDFLRAYYHHKSADWTANPPYRLPSTGASDMAKMPTYYIMDLSEGMAATVAREMPSAAQIAANRWLPQAELKVYSDEYARTGFQGGLQWYRCSTGESFNRELQIFSGRTIDVPSMFIAGLSDWGTYQSPGAFERMRSATCTRMSGVHLVEGAGHWVQQEQPEQTAALMLAFLKEHGACV